MNEPPPPAEEKAIKSALAFDEKFSRIAKRFARSEQEQDAIWYFLESLLHLKGIYENLSGRPKGFRRQAIARLSEESKRFLQILEGERSLVELYLAGWPQVTSSGLAKGKARVAEILSAIELIRDLAGQGQDVIRDEDLPELPRKRRYGKDKGWGLTVFVVRQIAKKGKDAFGKISDPDIALLANLVLGRKNHEYLLSEEVRNLRRPNRVIREA